MVTCCDRKSNEASTSAATTIDPLGQWQLRYRVSVHANGSDQLPLRLLGRIGSESRADLGIEFALPSIPGWETPSTTYRYNVWMSFGQQGHPPIWQGAATAVATARDSTTIDRTLATALLAVFGQTATG
ncbi:MAG: hypothetical protein HC826_00855, partial [Rhodospirillales bacterium]|nr:hypothetical protein [Rhodospirillales bacterium]